MNEDAVVGLTIAAIFVTIIFTIAVGLTWSAVNENNAIVRMVEAGAAPIEAGCALGNMATCDVIGRQR